jgi:hypothetical protein
MLSMGPYLQPGLITHAGPKGPEAKSWKVAGSSNGSHRKRAEMRDLRIYQSHDRALGSSAAQARGARCCRGRAARGLGRTRQRRGGACSRTSPGARCSPAPCARRPAPHWRTRVRPTSGPPTSLSSAAWNPQATRTVATQPLGRRQSRAQQRLLIGPRRLTRSRCDATQAVPSARSIVIEGLLAGRSRLESSRYRSTTQYHVHRGSPGTLIGPAGSLSPDIIESFWRSQCSSIAVRLPELVPRGNECGHAEWRCRLNRRHWCLVILARGAITCAR